MVGASGVVAQRHRAEAADEDRAGVGDLRCDLVGILGVDLQVLGAIGVRRADTRGDVVHQHHAGLLPAQGLGDALGVFGDVIALVHLGHHLVGQLLAVRDQHGGRHRVVLRLTNQVVGDFHRIGTLVGQHSDLGRARLGVDAHHRAAQPLGGGDEDVARAGHHIHRLQLLAAFCRGAVREQRHCLRPADGPDLLHAQQLAGRQHGRVRPAALLRRGGHNEGLHPGLLSRHDVHDHTRRVHRVATRRVQTHALDGDEPLGHNAARRDLHLLVFRPDGGVECTHPLDGLFECSDDIVGQSPHGGVNNLSRNPHRIRGHAVEALPDLQRCACPAFAHLVDDRCDGGDHRVHVRSPARQPMAQLGGSRGLSPQIDPAKVQLGASHRVRSFLTD